MAVAHFHQYSIPADQDAATFYQALSCFDHAIVRLDQDVCSFDKEVVSTPQVYPHNLIHNQPDPRHQSSFLCHVLPLSSMFPRGTGNAITATCGCLGVERSHCYTSVRLAE